MAQPPAALSKASIVWLIAHSVLRTVLALALISLGMLLVPDTIGSRSVWAMTVIVLVGLCAWTLYMRWAVVGIRRARYPRIRSAEALIVSIWLFVSVFASFYVTIAAVDPNAFTEPLDHFTAAYFALTVLATVGFGDITPETVLARSVSMVQMGLDLFIIGIAVKVLTSSADKAVRDRSAAGAAPGVSGGQGAADGSKAEGSNADGSSEQREQ